jgi:hypothetical protein
MLLGFSAEARGLFCNLLELKKRLIILISINFCSMDEVKNKSNEIIHYLVTDDGFELKN